MKQPLLTIHDLHAEVEGREILHGLCLTVLPGQIHAIMGPNGAGKSTLAKILAGHPSYTVTKGMVVLNGQNILNLSPEERACQGLFLGFQNPIEVPGVANGKFLRAAVNAIRKARGQEALNDEQFHQQLTSKMELLGCKPEVVTRDVNVGFSGGEKKRNEILQMALLDPTVAILDETDSGLDIDAMKIIASGVNRFMTDAKGLLLITHYQRLLKVIVPTGVHVMMEGRIVATGGNDLAERLGAEGYDWVRQGGYEHAL